MEALGGRGEQIRTGSRKAGGIRPPPQIVDNVGVGLSDCGDQSREFEILQIFLICIDQGVGKFPHAFCSTPKGAERAAFFFAAGASSVNRSMDTTA